MYNYKESEPNHIEFIAVASLSELGSGERLFIKIDELPIMVFNIMGELFAIGDVCSHDDGPLGEGEIEGNKIICPRHGARFDIRTGKALTLPAVQDIPAYPIRVVNDQIEIGIPE